MPSDVTLSDLAEPSNSSWQKTAQGVLKTTRLCAQTRAQLAEEEMEELRLQLDFSRPTFTKLAKIRALPQLDEEQVSALLPSHFSFVYQNEGMDDGQRDRAIIKPLHLAT